MSGILGIDLSLSGTGLALVDSNPVRLLELRTLNQPHVDDPFLRWQSIAREIVDSARQADTIMIEGYSFGSHMSHGRAIAEIGGIVRFALRRNGFTYTEVPPTSLKKFVSGSGASPKEIVIMECYKRWGIQCKNNNIADALVLAMIGHAIKYGTEDLPKFQQEVVETLLHPKPKKGKKRGSKSE